MSGEIGGGVDGPGNIGSVDHLPRRKMPVALLTAIVAVVVLGLIYWATKQG